MDKKMSNGVGLSAPWEIYRKKLAALFENDDDICVGEVLANANGEWGYYLGISVHDVKKFDAMQVLLPDKITFGNTKLQIHVYYVEEDEEDDKVDYSKLITDLFEGNNIFVEIVNVVDHVGSKHTFAVFKPKALQFYADDLTDPFGNRTMLAQDVAREIFRDMVGNEVQFTTSLISGGGGGA